MCLIWSITKPDMRLILSPISLRRWPIGAQICVQRNPADLSTTNARHTPFPGLVLYLQCTGAHSEAALQL